MLCSYSNRTSEAPHTSAANHGKMFIDGMMFFFTANFTRDMAACKDYLIQNTFGVKKARPSKVESYLEVNA